MSNHLRVQGVVSETAVFRRLSLSDWRLWGAVVSMVTPLLVGCAQETKPSVAPENQAGSHMLAARSSLPPPPHQLQPGDVLSIAAPRRSELNLVVTVDPQGYVSYPYIGSLFIRGRTTSQVADEINEALIEGGWYKRPEIRVGLQSAADQYVYVLGEVKQPGPITVSGGVDLLAAIGRAGGQTYDAKMDSIVWIRTSDSPAGVVRVNLASLDEPSSGDPKLPSLRLIPGDVVYLPDTTIASLQRYAGRIYDIVRTVVEIERGLVLYPDVSRFLERETRDTTITIAN